MGARIWAALLGAVLVAVACFAVVSARHLGTQRPPTGALAVALAARTETLLETTFRAATGPAPVACAARPFGARPEGLRRAADATTIYPWVHCRGAGGQALAAPVALRLDGEPALRVPERAGRAFDRRSLDRIFPADVRPAMAGTRHDDLAATAAAKLG